MSNQEIVIADLTDEEKKEIVALEEEVRDIKIQIRKEIFQNLSADVRQTAIDIRKVYKATSDIYDQPHVEDPDRLIELRRKEELADYIFNSKPTQYGKSKRGYSEDEFPGIFPQFTLDELEKYHLEAVIQEDVLGNKE